MIQRQNRYNNVFFTVRTGMLTLEVEYSMSRDVTSLLSHMRYSGGLLQMVCVRPHPAITTEHSSVFFKKLCGIFLSNVIWCIVSFKEL